MRDERHALGLELPGRLEGTARALQTEAVHAQAIAVHVELARSGDQDRLIAPDFHAQVVDASGLAWGDRRLGADLATMLVANARRNDGPRDRAAQLSFQLVEAEGARAQSTRIERQVDRELPRIVDWSAGSAGELVALDRQSAVLEGIERAAQLRHEASFVDPPLHLQIEQAAPGKVRLQTRRAFQVNPFGLDAAVDR